MARFVRTRQARTDLLDIWDYIAGNDPAAADRLLDEIDGACEAIAEHPFLGPRRDDIRPGLRYFVHRQYLILYRPIDEGIEIVRIVHSRRDLFGLF